MKQICLILLFSCIIVPFTKGQMEATTADGKKVILNADGTWKYAKKSATGAELEAQCEYRINQTDATSGEIKRYTKLETIAKDDNETFKVSLRRNGDIKYLVAIYTGDLGCITKESNIVIKLLDGTVLRLPNEASGGCDAGETMEFELDFEIINKLSNSPFLRIRITGSDYFADLAPYQPNYFMNKLKCIE